MEKIQEIFNFDNIGGKIKNFAKGSCLVTIILIWSAALIMFFTLIANEWTAKLCWIPLVLAIVGPVLVWVGSWVMYAFGELVEDTHAIRNKVNPQREETTNREISEKEKDEVKEKEQMQRMPYDEKNFVPNPSKTVVPNKYKDDYSCPKCGCVLKFGQKECWCSWQMDWSKYE